MKAYGQLPDDPMLHRAALAYASDYTILEPILRAHGVAWTTPGLKIASLDHAMWWHRDARVDEWLLFTQESPSASGGRGLSLGRIYTREGVLVASVGQEGMVRFPTRRHSAEHRPRPRREASVSDAVCARRPPQPFVDLIAFV